MPKIDGVAGFRVEVLTMASDPPGELREAPGGGRVLTFAALFTPAAGENLHGVAVVVLPLGPGAHPLNADEPTRFAAERLAAKGCTVLSLYSHVERGHAPRLDRDVGVRRPLDQRDPVRGQEVGGPDHR